ncbi:schwannomin-interacting protein 1 homolog isoform X1 [Spodoptera litura]|uniref:Schwannomin-interacting protein 1 homolog isoform X1 n=1 Tax=Spodoptera litura TaxID=69820 RepID=A0A9J7IM85_SPOLT|nr:schwannomin-interacting protein 1 homolog isoform X1 [Spodoptera litura]XP_022820332.1 schwannomin-interacting protein 1 homolog isoform X1 [Spodoptera litura]
MRIKTSDNGNIAVHNNQDVLSRRNSDNRSWLSVNNSAQTNLRENSTDYSKVTNCNTVYSSQRKLETFENYSTTSEVGADSEDLTVSPELVCNKQYRINNRHVNSVQTCNNSATDNLEGSIDTVSAPCTDFRNNTNVYTETTPVDEERAFEHSDTDEMSENGIHPVPRGIVNPNYPGFQHLAHTLQDYSSNIENFYHSENEMTDDDVDVEITDLAYEPEPNQNETTDYKNINNNNNIKSDLINTTLLSPQSKSDSQQNIVDSQIKNDIPDLLKTISKNNNNNDESFNYELNCTDADIENNFHAKDIIGDFNKEIEDEIKQLLNYNINIQDDLEELRKDIKDTFAKPIENTINNISDVVNHVIKKLVETQCDENDDNFKDSFAKQQKIDEISEINKENEKNIRTEMNLSRPTFLLIENNTNDKITDAFLSDGKDEININDYNTEKLSLNVENTIKQLSTELRKIIPKLDEMRERDRLWAESKKETVVIDGNSNEVAHSSKGYSLMSKSVHSQGKPDVSKTMRLTDNHISLRSNSIRSPIEPKASRDKQREITTSKNSYRTAQSKTSVRKNDNTKDVDLGSFDVYNIETALPKLDLDAIENHLKAAKEAERRKRNDREEIRRRLAMGADAEEYYSMGHTDRPGKKPSLHSRLQSGMNLQICFMNETASDNESQASDFEKNYNNTKSLSRSSLFSKSSYNHPYQTRPLSVNITKHDKISTVQSGAKLRPTSLSLKTKSRSSHSLGHIEIKESDFYVLQATLQTEARVALAQAKEMARIQMERERRSRAVSPVTEMLRRSMEKANAPLAPDRRRVSRQLLTDMNIAQLQVIVNELHSQIESLNDTLVKMLMARDELHMGQDSMLVDIEDLTRYLGVKEQTKKTKGTTKPAMRRLTSLVHK